MKYLRGKALERAFNALNLPPELQWENLTLANDFMFGRVMQNENLCAELLRRILPDIKIERVVFPELQKHSRQGFDLRGVRFDVITMSNGEKEIFSVDMQAKNTHDLDRRSWDYHLNIGLESLKKSKTKSGSYRKFFRNHV